MHARDIIVLSLLLRPKRTRDVTSLCSGSAGLQRRTKPFPRARRVVLSASRPIHEVVWEAVPAGKGGCLPLGARRLPCHRRGIRLSGMRAQKMFQCSAWCAHLRPQCGRLPRRRRWTPSGSRRSRLPWRSQCGHRCRTRLSGMRAQKKSQCAHPPMVCRPAWSSWHQHRGARQCGWCS